MLVKSYFSPATNNRNPEFAHLLDSLFDQGFKEVFGTKNPAAGTPAVNVVEEEKEFRLEVLAPGFAKEDFSISLQKGQLTIGAEKKVETTEESTAPKFIRKEYSVNSFKRYFRLQEPLDGEKISARYENGILYVHIPKLEPEVPVVREIKIV